jgi:hypothetical protein
MTAFEFIAWVLTAIFMYLFITQKNQNDDHV